MTIMAQIPLHPFWVFYRLDMHISFCNSYGDCLTKTMQFEFTLSVHESFQISSTPLRINPCFELCHSRRWNRIESYFSVQSQGVDGLHLSLLLLLTKCVTLVIKHCIVLFYKIHHIIIVASEIICSICWDFKWKLP